MKTVRAISALFVLAALSAGTPAQDAAWTPPTPRSARERADEREKMVERQIESPGWTRDAVTDTAVLRAMRSVPRHVFVPRCIQRRRLGGKRTAQVVQPIRAARGRG